MITSDMNQSLFLRSPSIFVDSLSGFNALLLVFLEKTSWFYSTSLCIKSLAMLRLAHLRLVHGRGLTCMISLTLRGSVRPTICFLVNTG